MDKIKLETMFRSFQNEMKVEGFSITKGSLLKEVKQLCEVFSTSLGTGDTEPNMTREPELVQSDSTKLDVVLVDDETGNPLGRPWLTISTDVFTGRVLGFHISLEPPSHIVLNRFS
ncbi:hypothetical protein NZD89_20800 [Alicyclobacillus fastidiosus]|uniref:Transposase n=1 Tax=Alicyclobacillus fastidiosus TaxID=392011 RepID=A0ABY6ZF07_9BACL|nr:hypothetical protein [Alicyclobacillus fastidiosus]WAH40715.1 hypothetical protein NZD89_20800 [Alicyclobacillus fastidiosus]GMA62187.1 hypothetical protein GCM10025859_26270 [Alicyclobacillus fastidiosus]